MNETNPLFLLLAITPLFSISIEFQSKLYISPKDGENLVWKQSKNSLCIQAKYGTYTVDVNDLKRSKILKKSSCNKFGKFHLESESKEFHEKWGYGYIVYSPNKKTKFIVRDNIFFVLDISNPKEKKIIGEYEVFKYENHMYISDIIFSKDEKYLFVINSITGVQIYDMSDVNNFKTLGKLEKEIGTDDMSGFRLVDDKYLYGSILDSAVIIDVRNKMKPKLIESDFMESEQELFSLDKKHLLLVHDNLCDAGTWFVKILDISNPLKPKESYSLKIKDFRHDLLIDGDRIFFLGNKGLHIYKVKR